MSHEDQTSERFHLPMLSTCQEPCPLNAADFQKNVTEGMTELRTLMAKLVGKDGNNGEWSELKARVTTLETFMITYMAQKSQEVGFSKTFREWWLPTIAVITLIGNARHWW